MSSICKYYLKGSCMYGDRCYFLHEQPGSSGYNYNRDGRSARLHSNYSIDRRHSQTNSAHYGTDEQQTQNSKYEGNFDKYHIDRRSNSHQSNMANSESPIITTDFLIAVIREELLSYISGKIWPFTVISLGSGYGNLPGYKDYSPDELRFAFWEAIRENNHHEFERNLTQLQETLKTTIEIYENNSEEVRRIADELLAISQKPISINEKNSPNSASSAASSFSFSLSKVKDSEASNNFSFAAALPQIGQTDQQFSSNDVINAHKISCSFASEKSVQPFSTNFFPNSGFSTKNCEVSDQTTFGGNNSVQSNFEDHYSCIEQLSDRDIAAFKAETFTLKNIPLCPPPQSLL